LISFKTFIFYFFNLLYFSYCTKLNYEHKVPSFLLSYSFRSKSDELSKAEENSKTLLGFGNSAVNRVVRQARWLKVKKKLK